jgi:class 3 adenylate cyclase
LVSEHYAHVAVLAGGLSAWVQAGYPLAPIGDLEARRAGVHWKPLPTEAPLRTIADLEAAQSSQDAFAPNVIGQNFLAGQELPLRREMAVLFVDMVDSTPLLFRHSPEEVLTLVQAFMEVVVDVAVYHCGNVYDFQGDGALLYFAGPGEAVPAAFEVRDALVAKRRALPELPLARLALDMGPLVIGVVGTRVRRSVTLVGPSINIADRILKLAPPGGIIATASVVAHAKRTDPDLASRFARLPEPQQLKGVERGPLELYVAPA